MANQNVEESKTGTSADASTDVTSNDPPDYKALYEQETQARETAEKEAQAAKSSLGNARKRLDEQDRLDRLEDEIRATRLNSEALARGLNEEEAKRYVAQAQTRTNLVQQVNHVGNLMNDSLERAGINVDDPRLKQAYEIFDVVQGQSKSGAAIDVASVLRAQRLVDDIVKNEESKNIEARIAAAREEGTVEAKKALSESGALDMATTGGGAGNGSQPQTAGQAWKLWNEGRLSDADMMKWRQP